MTASIATSIAASISIAASLAVSITASITASLSTSIVASLAASIAASIVASMAASIAASMTARLRKSQDRNERDSTFIAITASHNSMKTQEQILLTHGRIDIEATPEEFPLGRRGQRPVRFSLTDEQAFLRVKELNIPGVLVRGMRIDATWDAAIAICRAIGEPQALTASLERRLTCAVPLPGKAKYNAGIISKSRRSYQADGIRYLLRRAYAILGDPPRCLSGDTEIVVNRATVGTRMKLRDLYYKFHGGVTLGGRNKSRQFKWDKAISTFTQSCDETDFFIKKNRIIDVYESGEKEVFKLMTERGHCIKASADHPFLTPTGWIRLSNLNVGDSVLTIAYPKASKTKVKRLRSSDHVDGCWFHPFARRRVHKRIKRAPERVARIARHRLIYEAHINGLSFEAFMKCLRTGATDGLIFFDPKVTDVHHLDGDYTNNDVKNLQIMNHIEHLSAHGQKEHWRHVTAKALPDRIVSISSCGKEMTYDISMEAPRNNFAANEFIVHNSGKCLMILGVVELLDVQKALIVCNSLGKYVWAEEVAKWLNEECVLLFGRAGHEARVFCKACMGRGTKTDEVTSLLLRCTACNGQGERTHTVRMLVQDTVSSVHYEEPTSDALERYSAALEAYKADMETKRQKHDGKEQLRYAKWEQKNPKRRKPFVLSEFLYTKKPPEQPTGQRRVTRTPVDGVWRCPKHKEEIDTYERACAQCKTELHDVLAKHRIIIVNYDILAAQKDKDDQGATVVRADLPGWGAILARFPFALAVADEAHKLRGWQGKGAGGKTAQTRRERLNEVCAEIPRVYAVTGTPIYGFVRDLWGQLDFISRGLWS